MKKKYIKEVILIFNGKKLVSLAKDIHIKLPGGAIMKIPKGFKTDLASVPRGLWWFLAPTDWEILVPAIMHDYFYTKQQIPKEVADFLFKIKMKDFGAGIIKRNLAWLAVRLFGKYR